MEKMGPNFRQAINKFTETVSADLSELLMAGVKVGFIPSVVYDTSYMSAHEIYNKSQYRSLEHVISEKELMGNVFDTYTETLSLLDSDRNIKHDDYTPQYFHSALLKSNCRVTSQPDWGDVYIYINSQTVIDEVALLKYIVSLRDECHFHEEIAECIYKRLYDKFTPNELFVKCLYARRGGIDINPIRASSVDLLYRLCTNLADVNSPHIKTSKQ
jgi:7-cyano-7-deazaguanine reductase